MLHYTYQFEFYFLNLGKQKPLLMAYYLPSVNKKLC